MARYGYSEEHQPVTYWGGYPIYAAHFIVTVLVAAMIATTICQGANVTAVWMWLPFDGVRVWHGEVWRMLTSGLLNGPSLWFAVNMVLFVWFGREVEKRIGRRKFLGLFFAVYLVTPVLLLALTPVWPTVASGDHGTSLAIFTAFATLYPSVLVFFNISAKWAALILVGIYTLVALSYHDWTGMLALWATNATAYGFIRYEQGQWSLPRLRWPRRGPKLRVLPDLPAATPRGERQRETAEIDALLDKISQSGFSSLTPKERAKLEQRRGGLSK